MWRTSILRMRGWDKYMITTVLERFEQKYEVEPNTGCWLWTAYIDPDGYGRIFYEDRDVKACRVSYQLFIGPIPIDLHVLHRCDTPACVNPKHLFLGTHADNMRDMFKKKRNVSFWGQRNQCSKGHNYTKENTYINPSSKQRVCRACKLEWQRKDRSKK